MKNKKTVIAVGSVLGGTFLGLICCAVVKFINRARRNG